ncbi:MAG TPA: hypothetical protein DCS88_10840 [Alphaproteobacteria bacterium]|nr:hypothetical protein [Alphaproteobacteria bacterium]
MEAFLKLIEGSVMDANTINGSVNSVISSFQLAATTSNVSPSVSQGEVRTAKTQESGKPRAPMDNVDLVGLESISQAFKTLGKTEPLPVPEPVFRAIQALARDVFEGLPGGRASLH